MFFFNDTATTEIYTLSLHDALPICPAHARVRSQRTFQELPLLRHPYGGHDRPPSPAQLPRSRPLDDRRDRKSTRLNSSHANISYAVFCLKKKTTSSDCRSCTPYPLH